MWLEGADDPMYPGDIVRTRHRQLLQQIPCCFK